MTVTDPTLVPLLFYAFISLFGLFFVSTFLHVARRLRKETAQKFLQESVISKNRDSNLYFRLHRFLFNDRIDTLLFCLTCLQNALRVLYLLFLYAAFFKGTTTSLYLFSIVWDQPIAALEFLAGLFLVIISFILMGDLLPRTWACYASASCLRISAPIASFFLLLFLPFTFLLFRLVRLFSPQATFSPFAESTGSAKEKLFDAIRNVDDGSLLNEHDKKLLQSVFTFRDRIAREVMVPRVNLSCISIDATIREAAHLFEKEEYSRVPVYKNTIDQITGVLMYKDILLKYMQPEPRLDESIEKLTKSVIYTPETKKISQLLQEFRKKQTHIAIVVDEYGGTAGIVTIEDILEEIVGEIADEYDDETALFRPAGKGTWVVDARMNLLDLEEELGIKIPQEGEYDTIAGYIFFSLGTIPQKGVVIHHDQFELEILASNDRVVEKVKIIATHPTAMLKQNNPKEK